MIQLLFKHKWKPKNLFWPLRVEQLNTTDSDKYPWVFCKMLIFLFLNRIILNKKIFWNFKYFSLFYLFSSKYRLFVETLKCNINFRTFPSIRIFLQPTDNFLVVLVKPRNISLCPFNCLLYCSSLLNFSVVKVFQRI